MHPVAVPFELLAPGLIFAAGGFYFVVRSALRQLSDTAIDTKRHAAANHYRYTVILLTICPAERRDQIASWLLQSVMGD